MSRKIFGSGLPIKKAPYGTEYVDKRSGINYIQTKSPEGSDWTPSIDTPQQVMSSTPFDNNIESTALSQRVFSVDSFS